MWIKICGNTRLQDCLLAAELGADAVGFVFAAGKRTVTAEQVASITSALPGLIEKIGVFTSVDADEIAPAALRAGLTGIQLHSQYDDALVRSVRAATASRSSMRLLQVVHWDLDLQAADQIAAFSAEVRRIGDDGLVDALLVDSRTARVSGGTGRTFDWAAAAPVLAKAGLPVIVAGGLNPDNVAGAITALNPLGVDVSSGIEASPGVKDAEAVRQFIQNARAATPNQSF
ncbi:MAG: phosphoribosylanthranilate isomerase [Janthinobacterium lividum]